ncbi:MAG: HlyD family efflux transporter periplasmic adaptor subunit [Anaerolineaceae bacterium]|nr:HlyD family efflux transporter periplasmic adaptor subunit [Anaerolineaceae bacterium]
MKKIILGILAVGIIAVSVYWFVLRPQASLVDSQETSPTQAALIDFSPLNSTEVEALGHLVPGQYSDLHFRTNGVIETIFVKEGQEVQQGDILAKLRGEEQLKLAISQAHLDVMNAERVIADLETNAPLLAAQAFYDMSLIEKEIENVEKNRIKMDYPRGTQDEIDEAYDRYQDAVENFDTVSDYYNASDDVYKMAQTERNSSLTAYNWLIGKYSNLDKREQESNLILLERKLDDLKRQYEIYSQGPDPVEVELANARLQLAIDQRTVAEANYEDLTLYASFDGTVVQLNFEVGKSIAATQPLLLLADLTHWNVETEDLTELSVTRIKEGAAAQVSIDALPNMPFDGKVIEIKEVGETKRGDITYTVVIALQQNDPRLRWNMTSPITIATLDN